MSVVQPVGRPAVQITYPDEKIHRQQIAAAVNRAQAGHINSTLFVTLDPDVGSTAVIDERICPQTCVSLHPQTADAAAALPTTYVVCTNGSLTIYHANNSQTDRTFTMGMVG